MGLGKLNPGGNNCGCVVVPRPTDPCKYALYILKPTTATLEAPVISATGGRNLPLFNYWDGVTPVFVPNVGLSTAQFKPFDDEGAYCDVGFLDQFGLSQRQPQYPTFGYPSSHWPFASVGSCEFALTNYNSNRAFNDQISVGYFLADVRMRYIQGQQYPYVEVDIYHDVRISQKGSGCLIDYPLFTGVVSENANYIGGRGGQNALFVSQKSSPVNQFRGSIFAYYEDDYQDHDFQTWSPIRIQSQTRFSFSPFVGPNKDQREFNLWQPDPPVDPWGLMNQDVTVTLKLGI